LYSFIICIKTVPGRKEEGRFRQGCCLSPILFDACSNYFTKESLEGFAQFKIGQAICTVKCADELLLLAKEEAVLQGMIERLVDIGRCYGREMDVGNLR
jgi:hypothetical protein